MKQIASLSLDLDNQWSYMKTHGDAGWETYPSYLDVVVPRALSFFKDRSLDITFFIVGRDASLDKNKEAIRSIAEAGHEIGNHSFDHEPWLHLYSKQQLIDEFEKTESSIYEASGVKTIGFRGPGYSLSPTVLEVLAERGYEYDCSTLPTYIGPLARAYYFMRSPEMSEEEREKRKKLFGSFRDGRQPLSPHFVRAGDRDLIEIPVSTFPLVKTPIHASYVIYLASFSETLAMTYWRSALAACRATGLQPSILLHPLDFLSGSDIDELKFFPGMSMSVEKKLRLMDLIVGELKGSFEVVNMREHAAAFRNTAVESVLDRRRHAATAAQTDG
ncbi:MAG TPA: polysaccharide deacetylase family protein [Pyrinomonadaceae bacterium]|nr:polysaccharide deacetylase family protein [Pyrinomonadaceae bacterium]